MKPLMKTLTAPDGTEYEVCDEVARSKPGTPGKDGHTPVKGTDYFTDADKAELVEAVVDALPVYDGEVDGEIGEITPSNGKSAYEIAVDHGFDGTEEEWLASLKGEQGEPGENGSNGLPGLKGKKIAVLGDSVSSTTYTTPNYWQMIATNTGCSFRDYAVSGTCVAVQSDVTTSFVERAANMPDDVDAVLVMGGTNDVGKDILLGTWDSTDNTTFYGALNTLISLLRTKYSGKPIVFCTPIKRRYDTASIFPKTMADLNSASATTNIDMWHCVLAIQAKCAANGIPCIDLHTQSGIGADSAEYFLADDYLHPSILGEYRIANMIQPVLEQQFLYPATAEETPYTNLVPTSIDVNGNVYNGTGYMNGYRLSSSGGVSDSALSTATHTGFMPFVPGDTVRVIVPTKMSGSGNYFNTYNASLDFINNEVLTGFANNQYGTTETLDDGRVLVTIFTGTLGDIENAAYFRISANPATGASLVVTVNEEITA